MLTDKTKVKALMGITVATYDTIFDELCANVSGYIERVCNRKFTEADYTEYFDGGNIDLFVKNYPIKEIKSVKYNNGTPNTPVWVDVQAENYIGYLVEGIVHCLFNLPRGYRNIQVIYTGGFATVPSELQGVASELVAEKFNKRKALGKSKESLSGASIEWRAGMTDEQKGVIDGYKKIIL